MNILPKKRWHVRTKDNIARVRRDEAEAAEEEKKRVHRAKLAEQEARTAFLRNKTRQTYDGRLQEEKSSPPPGVTADQGTPLPVDIYTNKGNINFFKDLEEGKQQTGGTNKEHEEEKRKEQEKYEKSIGYLTYLGQDSLEASGGKAWYELDAGKVALKEGSREQEAGGTLMQEVGLKSKTRLDPINDIIKYGGLKIMPKSMKTAAKPEADATNVLFRSKITGSDCSQDKVRQIRHKKEVKKKKKKSTKEKYSRLSGKKYDKIRKKCKYSKRKRDSNSSSEQDSEHSKCKQRKMKREKHTAGKRKRSKDSSSSGVSSSSCSSSSDEEDHEEKKKKLELLRAERLKREAEERKRAERLLAGKKPDEAEPTKPTEPGFQRKYNSQFNPHIARQNQESRTLEKGVKYWLQ